MKNCIFIGGKYDTENNKNKKKNIANIKKK